MSKFNSSNYQTSHSTNSSAHSNNNMTPRLKRDKPVTAFAINNQSKSPCQNRVTNSPLQIPLAIALQKLTSNDVEKNKSFTGYQDNRCITDHHNYEISSIRYGDEQENISTKLIQNVKNILQQFAESLYCDLQREVYNKFNVQMKRMVVKYRETEKLLKKVQEKLIMNADVIEMEQQIKIKTNHHKREIQKLQHYIDNVNRDLLLQKNNAEYYNKQIERLEKENSKLLANLQKYQNIMLKKFQEAQISSQPINNISYCQQNSGHQSKRQSINTQTQQYHQQEIPATLTSSYILNVNQIAPSHSPLRKQNKSHRPTFDMGRRPKGEDSSFSLIKKSRLS